MEFNAKEAQERLSSNVDFINLMRAVCKISGWNTVLPDRVDVIEKTTIKGGISKEVIRRETVSTDTLIKYNGKREVWHNVRNLFGFSQDMLSRIEQGVQHGEEIKK